MATITFTLSTKIDKGTGLNRVLIRFVVGSRVNQRAKSSIFVPAKHWDAKKQLLTIPKYRLMNEEQRDLIDRLNAINVSLTNLRRAISEAYHSTETPLPKTWLVEFIDQYDHPNKGENNGPHLFSKAFDEYLDEHRLSGIRQRNIKVVARSLSRFEAYKGKPLGLDDVTADTLREFERYQRNEADIIAKNPDLLKVSPEARAPEERGENTIIGRMRITRAVLNWAYKQGRTANNSFTRYQVHSCVYGTPFYISTEERNRIYRMNLSRHPDLAVQRDIFVFHCLIGCRVSDLLKLTRDNLVNGGIEYIPKKTLEERGDVVRVPLNSIAKEIVEKYASEERTALLPFISSQNYNYAIKKIFLAARLTRLVTILDPLTRKEVQKPLNEIASSHIARRTFIGNIYRQVKDPNLVGKLSGHKEGSKAFARYRDIDEDIRTELVKMLE